MRRPPRFPAAIALLGCLLGCAARPVPPGSELLLADDEGFVVVHTYSRWPLRRIDLGGRTIATDIPVGEHLRLVRMPAGRYRWSAVVFQRYAPIYKLAMHRMEPWDFEVRPGVINYPVKLLVVEGRRYGGMQSSTARSINRSSYMLAPLLQQFPRALEGHPIVFTGFVRDDFLEHYRQQKLEREPPVGIDEAP